MTGRTPLPGLKGTRFGSVRFVPETGSTNADLMRDRATLAEGSVLVTDHQTAGRGRQQRAWHDEPGSSLLVSVLFRPTSSAAPLFSLLSGLAAVDGLGQLVPGAAVGLKWPNDVLAAELGERKLAGILSEATADPAPEPAVAGQAAGDEQPHRSPRLTVVVGMGMNLRWGVEPPAEIADRAATVAQLATSVPGAADHGPPSRDQVLAAYLTAFDRRLDQLEAAGSQSVLDDYRQRCLTVGRRVRFATVADEVIGTASGITPAGLLIVTADDGTVHELASGDAHHLPLD